MNIYVPLFEVQGSGGGGTLWVLALEAADVCQTHIPRVTHTDIFFLFGGGGSSAKKKKCQSHWNHLNDPSSIS